MSELESLLEAVVREPLAEDRWLVIADWLEENDDPRRTELLRLHRKMLATCCERRPPRERTAWQARIVELLGQGVQPCGPRRVVVLGDGVEMTFAFLPPGSFLMGSPTRERGRGPDETRRRVTFTRPFWMGVGPVTQAQWRAVTGENPSTNAGDELPVETVSFDHCRAFCRKLARVAGGRCRLPTEAEWEYACRAGTTTPFFFGETISTEQANYFGEATYGAGVRGLSRWGVTPVGMFPPNAWGLVDMHGNVVEWCAPSPFFASALDQVDPPGDEAAANVVVRGGSFGTGPATCRSAGRIELRREQHGAAGGCRVVLLTD